MIVVLLLQCTEAGFWADHESSSATPRTSVALQVSTPKALPRMRPRTSTRQFAGDTLAAYGLDCSDEMGHGGARCR